MSAHETALDRARAARQAKIDAGEKLERLDPLQKHQRKPDSLRLAVNAKCYDCVGRDCDPGWRKRVGECDVTRCPLHSVRPYQRGDEADDEVGT